MERQDSFSSGRGKSKERAYNIRGSASSSVFNESMLRGSQQNAVKTSANESKTVGFADDKQLDMNLTMPPEEAVLLHQAGFNFLDSDQSEPLGSPTYKASAKDLNIDLKTGSFSDGYR